MQLDDITIDSLAALTLQIGSPRFYEEMVGFVTTMLASDRRVGVSYGSAELPHFFFNDGMPDFCRDIYLSGYYRLDPFRNYSMAAPAWGIVSLRDVASFDKGAAYQKQLNPIVGVTDEIGIMLPGFGGETVGLFLERSEGSYGRSDVDKLRKLFPFLLALQENHLNYSKLVLERTALEVSTRHKTNAILVSGNGGRIFSSSQAWNKIVDEHPVISSIVADADSGFLNAVVPDTEFMIVSEPLQMEVLDDDEITIFAVVGSDTAPSIASDREFLRVTFGQQLTEREQEVVGLVLDGYPNALIARELGISIGTVKNHRFHIHNKLDITSEREIYLMALDALRAQVAG